MGRGQPLPPPKDLDPFTFLLFSEYYKHVDLLCFFSYQSAWGNHFLQMQENESLACKGSLAALQGSISSAMSRASGPGGGGAALASAPAPLAELLSQTIFFWVVWGAVAAALFLWLRLSRGSFSKQAYLIFLFIFLELMLVWRRVGGDEVAGPSGGGLSLSLTLLEALSSLFVVSIPSPLPHDLPLVFILQPLTPFIFVLSPLPGRLPTRSLLFEINNLRSTYCVSSLSLFLYAFFSGAPQPSSEASEAPPPPVPHPSSTIPTAVPARRRSGSALKPKQSLGVKPVVCI
jgi:hypothetical protein